MMKFGIECKQKTEMTWVTTKETEGKGVRSRVWVLERLVNFPSS